MRRRRRSQREITFSFDSFLDVVANVVGIILRLILVAWVGARTYKAFVPPAPPPPAALADPEPLPEPTDEREPLLAQRRLEIDRQRGEADRRAELYRSVFEQARRLRLDLLALQQEREQVALARKEAEADQQLHSSTVAEQDSSLHDLRERSQKLTKEIAELRQSDVPRKELRYRTPISSPVQTEELMFECRQGKVTLIDHGAMLDEVKREVRAKSDALRRSWQITELTAPVGAFRLRYVVERERGPLDVPGVAPGDGTFRYGVSRWEVVPITSERGETSEQALKEGSAFRRIIDVIEPQQTAVTFWVYPDSFALYRQLRDYLHEKEIVVAGRPLPEGVPVASSRNGTISRGQ